MQAGFKEGRKLKDVDVKGNYNDNTIYSEITQPPGGLQFQMCHAWIFPYILCNDFSAISSEPLSNPVKQGSCPFCR